MNDKYPNMDNVGDVLPNYTGVNGPVFKDPEPVHSPFDENGVYQGHIPEELDLTDLQRRAFANARQAAEDEKNKPKPDEQLTLEELQKKYLDGGSPSDDNRGQWKPIDQATVDGIADAIKRAKPGTKKLTIKQQNENELKHIRDTRRKFPKSR